MNRMHDLTLHGASRRSRIRLASQLIIANEEVYLLIVGIVDAGFDLTTIFGMT